MQCELSIEELRRLVMAVQDRVILARLNMQTGRGGPRLQETILKYEALQAKLLIWIGVVLDGKDNNR